MTPRERAEAAARDFIAWDEPEQPEITQAELIEVIEAAITEHVHALLAETPETMELLTYGPLDEEDARWTLTTLRRKALGE